MTIQSTARNPADFPQEIISRAELNLGSVSPFTYKMLFFSIAFLKSKIVVLTARFLKLFYLLGLERTFGKFNSVLNRHLGDREHCSGLLAFFKLLRCSRLTDKTAPSSASSLSCASFTHDSNSTINNSRSTASRSRRRLQSDPLLRNCPKIRRKASHDSRPWPPVPARNSPASSWPRCSASISSSSALPPTLTVCRGKSARKNWLLINSF